jgi:uncharacterized protein GlcG (DUF336 family)
MRTLFLSIVMAAAGCIACPALAQMAAVAAAPEYGPNITLDLARRAVAGAAAEARRLNVPSAIAVVDTSGMLVAFEKMDNTQNGSVAAAQDKAVSAALYRRPTKAFQDALAGAGAGLRILTLRGANAVEGGIPLTVGGRVVGAIGASGGTAEQDGEVARGGAAVSTR